MRGVFAVRFFTLFAIVCLVSGSVMNYNFNDSNSNEEPQLRNMDSESTDVIAAPLDEQFDGPEDSPGQKNSKDSSDKLIILGAGSISSLFLGSLFSEVFKITVLVSLLTPLISKSKNRNDLLTRGRLLGYLEANAGIHFSALRDSLGLANGVTAYHLQVLENNGRIISWKDGKLRRYAISEISKSKLDTIRNPIMGTRLAILEILSNSGKLGLSNSDIGKKLSISRQLMSYHISELRKSEYIGTNSEAKRPKWILTNLGVDALNSSNSFQYPQ
jgi:DNA-binding MarR family transcriptional regulator